MQIVINIIISFLLYALLSTSISVIYRTTRFFHIAHAITITLGAYFTYLFSNQFGVNIAIVIPLSIFFSVIVNLLILHLVYKPLQNKKTPNWQKLIASLGVYVVLQNLISICFGDATISFRTWEITAGHQFFGGYITDLQLITISVSIVLLILSWLFLENSDIGKQIKAVSSNPSLSNIFGIPTNKAVLFSFILGSVLASIAGILIAADTDLTPTMGFNWLLLAVVAMIIGGLGKMRYILMGAILLATAQHLSAYYINSKWMNATAYIILIIFLYFKPYGFSGKKLKKTNL